MPETSDSSSQQLDLASITSIVDSLQHQLYLILSIADLLSCLSPSSILDPFTLPTIGSFFIDELTQILTAVESLHRSISEVNSTTSDSKNSDDSTD